MDPEASRIATGRTRPPWRAGLAAAAVVALLLGAVLLLRVGPDDHGGTLIAAPGVSLGQVDIVVLSTNFDSDGARAAIPASVLDTVQHVAGVAAAEGAMRRFVDVAPPSAATRLPASQQSAVAMSWERGDPLDFAAGRAPRQPGEVAINQSLSDLYHVGVGGDLVVHNGPFESSYSCVPTANGKPICQAVTVPGPAMRVVGVFALAGGDVADINLVVLGADDLGSMSSNAGYDRVDIVRDPGTSVEDLLHRVGAALPAGYMAVPPSVVGFGNQLRAELEIQRAYHWSIDPDPAKRTQAIEGTPAPDPAGLETFAQHAAEIFDVEFRVSRVTFVDTATAIVTYRVYYRGAPSPIVHDVMTGLAQNTDSAWRIAKRGMCQLAHLNNIPCEAPDSPDPATLEVPVDGWSRADAVLGAASAFRVLADPTASLEARIDATDNGDALDAVIEAGLVSDALRTGGVSFVVVATRLLDASHAQVLYSLKASGEPPLETPYPLVGGAVLVNGTWRASAQYACGIAALAASPCPAPSPTTTVAPTSTSNAPPTSEPATTTS
jgi:hypothetical protein